jgi:ketosteroid isomerase-like protein
MSGAPREVVGALVDAYNAKRLEPLLDLYDPEARFWDPFHRDGVLGREAIGGVLEELFAAFPDERMSVVTLAADDTHAVAEFHSSGTGPTGDRFELDFTEVYEVRDGRIVSCRVYLDPEQLPAQPGKEERGT